MAINTNEVLATGRRKCAVARVRLVTGNGKITVNGKEMTEYFPSESLQGYVKQVFSVCDSVDKFDIVARIDGGGIAGQAGALRHGIARALVSYDEELRPALKAAGMMTRDARVKERKKSGQPGARRRFQFSKR
ncbi:MAG: 30S ribosomal protein S9 [Lentisphaeria bacterium]|nr:30S ribosomal protein S9 [Lentisphaeria bacterium]